MTIKLHYKKNILLSLLLFSILILKAQQESSTWRDFVRKKANNNLVNAVLNDYSYSGYHFSEKNIPDVSSWNRVDVTDYGAIPNDAGFDDQAIKDAIAVAQNSNQKTIVYFPAGRYKVGDVANQNNSILIQGSNIVLKGAGSGDGGTEIFSKEKGNFPWRFRFQHRSPSEEKITEINKRINRGDFEIEVQSTQNLSIGQTVELFHKGVENLEVNMPGLDYKDIWRIKNTGLRTFEKHEITSINGNKVTFKNPVQYTITADITGAELRKYETIEEVGVEDILFTSDWKNYPEEFVHHASDIVDYAWRAVFFKNVKNGWIRNCEFRDWNEMLAIEKCMGVTIENIKCSGKRGHTSYFARYSYGILFKDIIDTANQAHGLGMRWSTTSTVFNNCIMQKHQSIDCHGYHPYGNLVENSSGSFRGNGGAENSYPNSGPFFTFWNFEHDSNYTTHEFDFWDTVNRKTHTYVNPIFVGFTAPGENISFKGEKVNELNGQSAYPKSLFEAQLQHRLYNSYMSASSAKKSDRIARNANDNDDSTRWNSDGDGAGQWIMLYFVMNRDVSNIRIKEAFDRVTSYELEYYDGSNWRTIEEGNTIGSNKLISFPTISARRIRLNFNETSNTSVSLYTFKVEDNTLDNSDFELNDQVKIYPNPLKKGSKLIIHRTLESEATVNFHSISGQLLFETKISDLTSRIDLPSLMNGVYFVTIQNQNSKKTFKLLIQ